MEIFVHKHKPVKFNMGENGPLKVRICKSAEQTKKSRKIASPPIIANIF